MSADKHRGLAIDAAYLRLASWGQNADAPTGFGVNIKYGRALTTDIHTLIARGDVILQRTPASRHNASGKRISMIVATAQGQNRLRQLLARFGTDFGATDLLQKIEPRRLRKEVRRSAAADPATRRAAAERKAARLMKVLANRSVLVSGRTITAPLD